MIELDRREFLQRLIQMLAVTSVGLGLPVAGCGGDEPLPRATMPEGLLPDVDAAIAIGNEFLAQSSDVTALRAFATQVIVDSRGPIETQRRAISERIRSDFLADAVVTVQNWRLARTEASLCALLALEWRDR